MTPDKDRYRTLTAAAVLLVAAIAAIVSYLHVASLALRYGQPPVAAYLLPVSIDGLVATSSLVMLRAARTAMSAPWLARAGLVLAVGATLACNVAYGLPHGIPGALLSGWPAVAFIVAAEMAISMTRRRPVRDRAAPDTKPVTRRPAAKKVATSTADTEAAILAALASEDGITNDDLAARVGVSPRTARRYRSRLNGAALTSD
jgi:Protein of unknown function (DUF2637)/Winged helix-turn-helix DNA-binding